MSFSIYRLCCYTIFWIAFSFKALDQRAAIVGGSSRFETQIKAKKKSDVGIDFSLIEALRKKTTGRGK